MFGVRQNPNPLRRASLLSEIPNQQPELDYENITIGEDEVKSAARSCLAIVLILSGLAVIAIIFAIVAILN
jgi:hypothetical protein